MLTVSCEFVFFISLFMFFYVYAGYPLCVRMLSRFMGKSVDTAPIEPRVTVLIAAYNEEQHIGPTIANKLQLDYPTDKLQIIVISDDSTDGTEAIVNGFGREDVILLRQRPRAGKTAALNLAVPRAGGEIIVFSDANSLYAPDALRRIVANFNDPQIGYVTGKMIYTNSDGTPIGDGCSAYMKYENLLRSMETRIGSVVGVDGGIDAMRTELYRALSPDQLPDFVQPLKVIEQGYRVVYEPAALLKEATLSHTEEEYRMRVRVSLRSLWALYDMRRLLWGGGGFLFAWQLWSHKVLRYLVFIFLLGAYGANGLLWRELFFYKAAFILQTACYLGAFVSAVLERMGRQVGFLYVLHYFLLLNFAAGHAFLKFIAGKKMVIWAPRKG